MQTRSVARHEAVDKRVHLFRGILWEKPHALWYAAGILFGSLLMVPADGLICRRELRRIGDMKHLAFAAPAALLVSVLTATAIAANAEPGLLPSKEIVHVKDFKFNPSPLTIHAGDRVTFVNDDEEAHTITAADKGFDSAGLDTHAAWQHAFGKPGTYRYFCALHPYMKAVIVVLPAAGK